MMVRRFREEEASLPITILVAIVLGGVVVSLFAIVQSSQRSSARDRDVAQSIQIADAGTQDAFARLARFDELPETDPLVSEVGQPTAEITRQVGEGTYTYQATRIARQLWEVRSVGVYRTHTSVVETQLGLIPQFAFALWGESRAGIQAGNAVIGHLEGGAPAVGSNGPITLHNNIKALIPDQLTVECYSDEIEDAAANCDGITGADIIPGALNFVDLGAIAYAPRPPGSSVGGECWDSANDTFINDGVFDGSSSQELVRGETYCFSAVIWPRGSDPFQLSGPTDNPDQPGAANPVRIYVNPTPVGGAPEASVLVGGTGQGSIVNWEPVSTDDPLAITTTAAELLINVGGDRPVEFRNNSSKIAAGIYAPGARCEIRAQVTLVGALICGEVPTTGPGSASGGWSLWYDPALEQFEVDDVYAVRAWTQVGCNDTTFNWNGPSC